MISKIIDGVMCMSFSIDSALGAVSGVGTQKKFKKNLINNKDIIIYVCKGPINFIYLFGG